MNEQFNWYKKPTGTINLSTKLHCTGLSDGFMLLSRFYECQLTSWVIIINGDGVCGW